jgi:hypothetical protein
MQRPKETFKLRRLRDERVIEFDSTHALNLLRLDAVQAKREYELAEKNYTFKENEIYRNPSRNNSKGAQEQRKDNKG